MDGLGQIEIRVPETDLEEALEIIAVRFSEFDIDAFGPQSPDDEMTREPDDS